MEIRCLLFTIKAWRLEKASFGLRNYLIVKRFM